MSQKLIARWRRSNRESPVPRWTVSLILPHPLPPPEPSLCGLEHLVPEERDDDRHREQDREARVRRAVEEGEVQDRGTHPVRHHRRREQTHGGAEVRRQEGDRVED